MEDSEGLSRVELDMPTINHEYPVNVLWNGGRDGAGKATPAASGTEIDLRVPTEFQGPGGATNPEELLTTAIAGCYSITFGIIAANRKLPVTSLNVSAVGTVEQSGASFIYKTMVIRPEITVSAETTDAQVEAVKDMAIKADHYCIVTNAVRGKVEVSVEPTVIRA